MGEIWKCGLPMSNYSIEDQSSNLQLASLRVKVFLACKVNIDVGVFFAFAILLTQVVLSIDINPNSDDQLIFDIKFQIPNNLAIQSA